MAKETLGVKLRKYRVVIDTGENNFIEAFIPGRSISDVKRYCSGNGKIVHIQDITNEYKISHSRVSNILRNSGLTDIEYRFIVRALEISGITELD